ncbi:unnamed protein product, partial [marine sediment metagenome]
IGLFFKGSQIERLLTVLPLLGSEAGESPFWRVEMWKIALIAIKANPIFGIGYGRFDFIQQLVQSQKLQSDLSNPLLIRLVAQGGAHNAYLSIAVGLGIIGLTIYIFILFLGLKFSLSIYRYSSSVILKKVGLWLFLYFILIFITNFFGGGIESIGIYWFLGILSATFNILKRNNTYINQ